MSLMERPEAQELLEDATMSPRTVRGCAEHLTEFLARYLPLFYRKEQREHLRLALEGRLSGLERKTSGPIARESAVPRRAVQPFFGAGVWGHEPGSAAPRSHVRLEVTANNHGLVIDPRSFL